MQKIWTIASKDVYATFRDRSLLGIMFVAPLALATIITLAFGGIGGGSNPFQDLPVVIVNQDAGTANFNGGQILVDALIPLSAPSNGESVAPVCDKAPAVDSTIAATSEEGNPLLDMTAAVQMNDPVTARAAVDKGEYVAAIIIPANFSESISYTPDKPRIEPVPIEVYGDSGRTISPSVIRSIVEGFTNQFITGSVAVAATIDTMVARAGQNPAFGLQFAAGSAAGTFQPNFACAFTPAFNTIGIDERTVTTSSNNGPAVLVLFGSAQAAFFALFTANGGASSILEERRDGTLQRMIVSPTPRIYILIGKLVGTFVMVLLQLVFLFIAFTVIGSIFQGQLVSIWGTNILGIVAMLLATSAGAAGVGMVTAAVGKTVEQGQIIGSLVSMAMGILGGAFFSVQSIPGFDIFTRISVVRWGAEGFAKLSNGQTDILPNVVFLILIGAVLFVLSLWMFNRRQDI